MAISQINTNSIANGAVTSADLAAGAARANFGAGAVLQVVQGSYATQVSTSGSQVDTGLTATITPSSSTNKILVIANQQGLRKEGGSGNSRMTLQLYRGATALQVFDAIMWTYTSNTFRHGGFAMSWLDSPATTSPVTYKTTVAGGDGTNFSVQADGNSGSSTIILLEIAA